MNSGNTYRMKADGSHAEYFTHGQVNPFGLAFDPLGNLYSSDCHSRPVYQLLQGAWYPSFGKPDDGLGFGPEMVSHDHGSTGIAGISYYAADQFPEAYRGMVFVGNVVTNRINHDRIEWHGSTPKGIEQPDFVWSEDNWFRPVDIELGPDGALYIADFYNRIIGHYEVPLTHPGRDRERGRIWRIVYRGNGGQAPPPPSSIDRTRTSVDALVADLGHPNLAVRIAAANQLVDRGGDEAVAAVRKIMRAGNPARRRVHGLWVLQPPSGARRRHAAGLRRRRRPRAARPQHEDPDRSTGPAVDVLELALGHLKDTDPFVRRAAAEVLGAHPAPANIKPLLALRQSTPADDTHLIHVARMALRDQFMAPTSGRSSTGLDLNERDRRDIADVATGVHTPQAAALLARSSQALRRAPGEAACGSSTTSRGTVPADRWASWSTWPRPRSEVSSQRLELLKAMQQGAQERGCSLDRIGPAGGGPACRAASGVPRCR